METLNLGQHISQQFNEELEEVRNKVLKMGGIVEEQLVRALRALIGGDPEDEHTEIVGPDDDDEHTEVLSDGMHDQEETQHLEGGTAGAAAGSRAAAPAAGSKKGQLQPGSSFGTRYRIESLLGFGGMGAVYKAWDTELEIPVALKIIRPEVARDPALAEQLDRRFKRELLLARQVTHKNVVRIHDLGEIDGIKYITMTYIEGEDLLDILKRDGTVPVPEALKIVRPVVAGLVAAGNPQDRRADSAAANLRKYGRIHEACQVAVRATQPMPLQVTATPLTGPSGATIDAVTLAVSSWDRPGESCDADDQGSFTPASNVIIRNLEFTGLDTDEDFDPDGVRGLAGRARLRLARAEVREAELNLEFTEVRAPVDGYVTNLNLRLGSQVVANQPVLALVDVKSFWVDGYFRETAIGRLQAGNRAVVTLMTYPDAPLEGVVDSIGWGIAQQDGSTGFELLPNISPTFEWIRLAQRVPVRIHLTDVPPDIALRVGTTCSVLVMTGTAGQNSPRPVPPAPKAFQ